MAKQEKAKQAPVQELAQDPSMFLDAVLAEGIRAKDADAKKHGTELVRNFVEELMKGMSVRPGVTKTLNEHIVSIDSLLSAQLNEILHHPDFQRLEAAWRGLKQFVSSTETGEFQKIRVLDVGKTELLRDFQSASEFTESALWKKVYQGGYGQAGADPFAMLIGDFEFDKGGMDIELLQHISAVAAGAHAPFVAAAGAGMFGMESFTELPEPRDLAKIFDKSNPANTKWLSFRDSDDSRYVALCLPHVLGRQPYGEDNKVDEFDFQEDVDGNAHDKYLWANAAYSFASRATDAFAKHHWTVAIRGLEGGGKVENLPIHKFRTREGDISSKCPTEVLIPDDREKELSDLGFVPLINYQNTDYAVFFGASSAQRPKKFQDANATANAFLSAQLPYLFSVSRIAHYLKVICRDKTGSFMSRGETESFLNKWISNYVLLNDEATQEQKAKFPLREARIDVVEDKARPGFYSAIAYLRPHFQLEGLNVSLRLVASLPGQAK
ncbi:MAG: type VI secretion system contractile sheath large subunit [Planctomycetes bacterium]|nr:type VI secretion system contractile sheath large subunit [Planctomycetota bacterium]MBZ0151968.1 type VI secretion system contractile sheath large subunit [Planctomycetota bacterium]MCC7398648.1 type VI secretion system contractile sheath large subunit [Planctomycetota bacterium]